MSPPPPTHSSSTSTLDEHPLLPGVADVALQQIEEGVIVVDESGRIVFVNEAARTILGEAGCDDCCSEAQRLPEDVDGSGCGGPLRRALRDGVVVEGARWRVRRPDGRQIRLVGRARPVLTAEGERIGGVLTFREEGSASDHEARSQAVMARELRDAFEQSPVSMIVYDPRGYPIAANAAFARLWGGGVEAMPPGYSVLSDPQLAAGGALSLLRRAFGLDGARGEGGEGEAVALPAMPYVIPAETGRGRTLWVRGHAYPVRDAEGRVERVVAVQEDVTARERAEAALRESELRYRTLFESVDEGFAIIEVILDDAGRAVDYRFIETNPAFAEQTGLIDAPGRTAREMVPDLEQSWFEAYGEVARTGRAVRFESGSEAMGRWFDVHASRIGRPEERRVAVLFSDVSDARRHERERERLLRDLEVERSRLAYVFEHAPAFLAVLRGPDHVFERVNAEYYRIVGDRDLVGRPVAEALPELRGQGFLGLLDEVLQTGQPVVGREVPVRLRRSDGAAEEVHYVDFTYLPLVEGDGERTGVIAHGTDVTEQVMARHEVERARARADRLQELTAALAGANTPEEVAEIVVARGVEATGAATGMLALCEGEEGVMLRQQGIPEDVARSYARFPLTVPGPAALALREGEVTFVDSVDSLHARFPGMEGIWKRLGTRSVATVPLVIGEHRIGVMSFTFTETHPLDPDDRDFFLALAGQTAQAVERARLFALERSSRAAAEAAQMRAERAQREAREANRAKSAFLATMSHEIRTPINAIVGYAQLMEIGIAGPVTEQQRGYLGRLVASSDHLRGLVDEILDLAKIDAGGMAVARTQMTAGALVSAALDLVRPQARAKSIDLLDEGDAEGETRFVGDEHRVRQVLVNLLANAIKFTHPEGRVTVRRGCVDRTPPGAVLRGGGPWAFISISDTGIGIPAEEHGRIFDPFHQVDAGHTRQQGGTGLGLAISRRLARLMGGDLSVESAPDRGSTFTLWLPAEERVPRTGEHRAVSESADERSARAHEEPGTGRVHGLADVGAYLRERIEEVIAAYVERLRADPMFSAATQLRRAEIVDHQLPFLADVAQTLVVIEEAESQESALLRDGSTIQRIVSELHGTLRRRQGWTAAQLECEYAVLNEEVARVVRRRSPEDEDGELGLALDVLERLLGRARGKALAAWERAGEDAVEVAGRR